MLVLGCLAAAAASWSAPAERVVGAPVRPKLTAAQLKLLTTPVSRDQQLAVLRAGPSAVRQQVETALTIRADIINQTPVAREKLWREGFDLLPYRVCYPAPGVGVEPLAELRSNCVQINDNDFPPRAEQETPTLELWNPREESAPILSLRLHHPGAGLLMVTFSAHFSGYISGQPILLKWYYPSGAGTSQQTELLPSDYYSKWTGLVPTQDKELLELQLWKPRVVTLGGVTLRKL